jgi:hypothetical protein
MSTRIHVHSSPDLTLAWWFRLWGTSFTAASLKGAPKSNFQQNQINIVVFAKGVVPVIVVAVEVLAIVVTINIINLDTNKA